MKKILFIAPNKSTFVTKDLETLKKKFNVVFIESRANNFKSLVLSQLNLFFKILRHLGSTSLYFTWFADYHSFLPSLFSKIFRIKSILIIGGSDVNYIPDLKVGNVIGPLGIRKFCVKYSINNSNLLLPVDNSLIEFENTYIKNKSFKMGISFFSNNNNIQVLPTGINTTVWKSAKKNKQFVTVAISSNYRRHIKKGINMFLKVAESLPDYKFYLVGGKKEELSKHFNVSQNVVTVEYMDHEELSNLLSESKIFLSFSLSEGLPNVLLEAMASGCIPVVSNVNGMPAIAENFGYVLKKEDEEEAKNLCLQSLTKPEDIHSEIENYIKENFNEKKRMSRLLEIVENTVKHRKNLL